MKNRLVIWLGVWIAFMVLLFTIMKLDLWSNPWLYEIVDQWKWYNFITSHHGLTALYIQHNSVWLVVFPASTLLFSGLAILDCQRK
ncbi:MAG: hypothetical protein WC668_04090 [Patescibacteria group bacterium]